MEWPETHAGVSKFWIERGPVNYSLHFADSAKIVLATWNKLGWKLKAVDETRDVEGLEGYASIGVSKWATAQV